MRKNIGVFSNKSRNLDYGDLLSIYSHKEIDNITQIDITDLDALIVDTSEELIVDISNLARKIKQSISLIIVLDSYRHSASEDMIKNIIGIGRTEVVYSHKGKCYGIVEAIERTINPSLPSKNEDIAIMLPIFNEAERIEHITNFIKKLEFLSEQGFPNISFYLINDGSSDYTESIVSRLIENENESFDVVFNRSKFEFHSLEVNTKKAGTYIEAFKMIEANIIIVSDADDSFENQDISRMINILNQGYFDIVVATKDKTIENRSFIRKIISFAKRLLTKPLLPNGVTDSQTGLKAFNKTSANYILPELDNKYGLAIDLKILNIAKKFKFRVYQLPVECIEREGSHVELIKDSVRFLRAIFDIALG